MTKEDANKVENRAYAFFQLINAYERNEKNRLNGEVGKKTELPKNVEEWEKTKLDKNMKHHFYLKI